MRTIFTVTIILLICFSCNAQSSENLYNYNQGRRFIRKAERSIEEKNYAKAEIFLEKALKSDLGYCGLGTLMSREHIYLLKVQIYREQKQYETALSLLDSVTALTQYGRLYALKN